MLWHPASEPLEQAINAGFRDEILLSIGEEPGDFTRRLIWMLQGQFHDLALHLLRNAIPKRAPFPLLRREPVLSFL
jgi:hypothetical protein